MVQWFGPWLLASPGYTHLYFFLDNSEHFIRLYKCNLIDVVARKMKVVLYIAYCNSIAFAVCEGIERTLENYTRHRDSRFPSVKELPLVESKFFP